MEIGKMDNILKDLKKQRLIMLLAFPFMTHFLLFYFIDFTFTTLDKEAVANYSFYIYIHKIWIIGIPSYLIFIIYNYRNSIWEAKTFLRPKAFLGPFFFIGFVSMGIGVFYIATKPDINIIHSIYLLLFIWGILGTPYYIKKWNSVFTGEQGEKYKKILIEENFTYDIYNETTFFSIEKNKEKGLFSKIEDNPTLMKLGLVILLPFVSAVTASEADNGLGVYILLLIVIFIFPVLLSATCRNISFFNFIKSVEKEYNITIKNGKWKVSEINSGI